MHARRLFVACFALSLCCLMAGTRSVSAAEPVSLTLGRTTFLYLRKGGTEAANFSTLNLGASDKYVVLLAGTGQAKLTVSDADETGDTINVSGAIQSALSTTFNQSATSPDQVIQPVLVTGYGILTFDVKYTSLVNSSPTRYFYNLKF